MKVKYISYRKQALECDRVENRFELPCVWCNQVTLVCVEYKDFCRSGACRDDRFKLRESLKEGGGE